MRAFAMKIGELAKRSGLTGHTIRYYERIGLLPRAERDRSNQRDYDDAVLRWIEFLGRLKTTGMPIREMLVYARLRAEGASTTRERRALLERHRVGVRLRLSELQASLLVLDEKVAGYAGATEDEQRHDERKKAQRRSV
jgi:DNA-binding transcriptional MerR regulator